jgi:hypothetical protein
MIIWRVGGFYALCEMEVRSYQYDYVLPTTQEALFLHFKLLLADLQVQARIRDINIRSCLLQIAT